MHLGAGAITSAQSRRRGPLTMALLWLTMVTCFPSVLIGFAWFHEGLSLGQVIVCACLSGVLLLIYTVPIAQISASEGKGYGMLNRELFGQAGSMCMNILLVILFVGFYGLAALLLAESLHGLFHTAVPIYALATALAFLMAFNNFFGFQGIANFARFIAAPLIIGWVFYTLFKAAPACTASALTQPGVPWQEAFASVSSFIIGFAIWGNEADYWRHGKPRLACNVIPLAVSITIGAIIFPTTGWLVAKLSGISDFGAAAAYMNNYSFGGIATVAALVLSVSYFACNDSCLFGSAGALQVTFSLSHRASVAALTALGMLTAFALSICGATAALEAMVSINSVVLPIPTLIVIADWFLAKRLRLPRGAFKESDTAKLALMGGITLGLLTCGLLPGTQSLHSGTSFAAAWLFALAVFIPLRLQEQRRALLKAGSAKAATVKKLTAAGR